MKRFILLTCIILASCTAIQQPNKETTVKFNLSVYDSGRFPTKSFATEIAAKYPNDIALTLTNTATNAVFNVTTGEAITLPIGTYSVAGTYAPDAVQKNYGSTKFISYEPGISVNDEITIVGGTEEYLVNAEYTSFAIGIDPAEVTSWKVKVKDGSFADVSPMHADDLDWVFATGYFSESTPLIMTFSPSSGSPVTYQFTLDTPGEGQVKVEYGKWYLVHAGATTQAGTFSINHAWEEGTLE